MGEHCPTRHQIYTSEVAAAEVRILIVVLNLLQQSINLRRDNDAVRPMLCCNCILNGSN